MYNNLIISKLRRPSLTLFYKLYFVIGEEIINFSLRGFLKIMFRR